MIIRIPADQVEAVEGALSLIRKNIEAVTGVRNVGTGEVVAATIKNYALRIGGDLPDYRGGTLAEPATRTRSDDTLDATRGRLVQELKS